MSKKMIWSMGVSLALLTFPLITQAAIPQNTIKKLYVDYLDRQPTAADIKAINKTKANIANLQKVLNLLPERDTAINKIFQAAFWRNSTAGELKKYKGKSVTVAAIKKELFAAPERKTVITAAFKKVVCRDPRPDELALNLKLGLSMERISTLLTGSQDRCVPLAVAPKELSFNAETKEVVLDGSASSDPGNGPLNYNWVLNPDASGKVPGASGTVPSGVTLQDSQAAVAKLILAGDPQFNDYYALPGSYTIQLTVTNLSGFTSLPLKIVVKIDYFTSMEKLMLSKVNALRVSKDVSPLVLEPRLTAAARKYSYYMRTNDWFEHLSKENVNFDARVTAEKYPFAVVGENILVVKSNKDDLKLDEASVTEFYEGWKNSPKHYENMVHTEFTEMGAGFSLGASPNKDFPFAQYGAQSLASRR